MKETNLGSRSTKYVDILVLYRKQKSPTWQNCHAQKALKVHLLGRI